ncbi:MAG: hypothetical protein ACI892_001925 [Marinobacter maritimus]
MLPFVGDERLNMPDGLLFSVKDYIMLVEDIPVELYEKISVVPSVQAAKVF